MYKISTNSWISVSISIFCIVSTAMFVKLDIFIAPIFWFITPYINIAEMLDNKFPSNRYVFSEIILMFIFIEIFT